jgi:phenylpropionate dioxygenase-like ring-hydroxylating dioxygenase large terminal subunit
MVITDPAHVATAHQMRLALAEQRRTQQQAQQHGARHHSDGHPVAIRALPDYDALFGVEFNPSTPSDLTVAITAETSNP